MAEEEVIILESADAAAEEEFISPIGEDAPVQESIISDQEADATLKKAKKKKMMLYGGIVASIVVLTFIIVLIFLMRNTHDTQFVDVNASELAQKLNEKEKPELFNQSKLEDMIQKANMLYERGDKQEALKIYERIATFNEAISHYNIGVAQMREQNFKDALESFKKAIENQEQRCVSAINAAVSSLELGDEAMFRYYIDLAYAYVPLESKSPLYSYYLGLIHYYKDFNYEALAAFSHPSSKSYANEQNYLAAKILATLDQTDLAINKLEKNNLLNDSFTKGLLYAKLGEYSIANRYLSEALQNTNEPLKTRLALALVQNKLGFLNQSATLLKQLYEDFGEEIYSDYPIKVTLKNSLFDVQKAQREFAKELFFNTETTYGLLFYFAPFKVFDAQQTINYIRKGGLNVFIDEIGPALSYLKTSSTISKVNISISNGIKKALEHHTLKANEIFKSMSEVYPQHSILHYNLALTYAQMGNFSSAYKYFKKSYNLDNTNYLAGVFAIFCGQLIHEDIAKLSEDVKDSISRDKSLKESNLYMSLVHLGENNQASLTRWLEEEKPQTPFHFIFDTMIAYKTSNETATRVNMAKLKATLPKDLVSNIVDFNIKHNKDDIKQYAKAVQIEFKNLKLDLDAFFYGPRIAQEQYTKLLQIGGLLFQERNALLHKMELERYDLPAIMQTMAYINIYTQNFEEAYTLYNKLIDEFKQTDTKTLFLASVASIGAKHSENAIALLELSKLTDAKNNESRYALGLLYHEAKNIEGANIQYLKIGDTNFQSKYFSFQIGR
ncbi:MAG: tetratricopeptide repeat protein [Sulfurospirillum sp.]|nr:tetratricopeptide repeat protein [Sulfurospirillum sp.]